MKRVYANGRTIVHRGDGLVDVSGPPDVCKTPSPAGPVPVPYVNVARTADLALGARRTAIGGDPIALASSCIATSTGDEPGTAGGGVISSRIRGKLRWQSTSLDVKVEGRGVARFSDAVGHNGNTFNTAFMQQGSGWAYGDDRTTPCPICDRGPDSHRVLETHASHARMRELYDALTAEHAEWTRMHGENDARKGVLELEKQDIQDAIKVLDAATPVQPPGEPGPSEPAQGKAKKKGKAKAKSRPEDPVAAAIWDEEQLIEAKRKELQKELKEKSTEIGKLNNALSQKVVFKKQSAHGGYMLGVMVCKAGKVYAAMSGQKTLPGFAAVVKRLGWELCDSVGQPDGYASSNPTVAARRRETALAATWADVKGRSDRRETSYNAPGECAAAKLVAMGHVPESMSEMFFTPKARHPVTLRYQHRDRLHLLRAALKWFTLGRVDLVHREVAFEPGTTVPSCLTCQTIVPMALCDVAERPCTAAHASASAGPSTSRAPGARGEQSGA